MGFRLRIKGERACFARPELRIDRISYDVITPLAVRSVLEAIYWRHDMAWKIDRLHVINPIRTELIVPGEHMALGRSKIPPREEIGRDQIVQILLDVDYVAEVHFDLAPEADERTVSARHTRGFLKRMRQNRFFREPYLGTPGFPATVSLIDKEEPLPTPDASLEGTVDLGWMTHDMDENDPPLLRFFRGQMVDGVIDVPDAHSPLIA